MPNQPFFKGHVIKGSGVGSAQGIPTLNIDLADIPPDLEGGIYAARVTIEEEKFDAAVHYGERPVHGLGRSFELHILEPEGFRFQVSGTVTIEMVKRLREVRDFESEEELKWQINDDIEQVKSILGAVGA